MRCYSFVIAMRFWIAIAAISIVDQLLHRVIAIIAEAYCRLAVISLILDWIIQVA